MAPSSDTILASLHAGKNPRVLDDVSAHLKSLTSNFDIACFSTSVANQVFKDLPTASKESSPVLLKCAQLVISHLETLPDSFLTKSLQPLGVEMLWQKLVSKLLEQLQHQEAKKWLAHLLSRLQVFQAKQTSGSKKDKELIPHSSDSTEFRKRAVSALQLQVQAANIAGDSMDTILSVLPRWIVWVEHLGEKDEAQVQALKDSMVRQLFSCALKKRPDEKQMKEGDQSLKKADDEPRKAEEELAKCLLFALRCLHSRRDAFFESASRFSSQFYEKLPAGGKQLIAFHGMVCQESTKLPSPQTLEVEYVLWQLTYASALINDSNKKGIQMLRDLLSYVKKYSTDTDIDQATHSLVSLCLALGYIREGDYNAPVPHLTKTTQFLSTRLKAITVTNATPPQQYWITSKPAVPYIHTLVLKLMKSLDELRLYYHLHLCTLRRKTDASKEDPSGGPSPVPVELLRAMKEAIASQVEVVSKGLSLDQILTKPGAVVDVFSNFQTMQVEALHAVAQLYYEITRSEMGSENDDAPSEDESAIILKGFYSRSLSLAQQQTDKNKLACLNNLTLRTFQFGNLCIQKSLYKIAVNVLEISVKTNAQLDGTLPVASSVIYGLISHCHSRLGDLEAAVTAAEEGLKLEGNKSSTNLLEQYVLASSKVDPARLSSFLPRLPDNSWLIEELAKAYPRVAPSTHRHHLAVVDLLLGICDRRKFPIKHAGALVEKAKLIRLIADSSLQTSVALLDKAIELLDSAVETSNKYVKDELAKAHAWAAICLAENHNATKDLTNECVSLVMDHAVAGLGLWEKLVKSLQFPSEDSYIEQNKNYFMDPAASIRIMRILSELFAMLGDVSSQVLILELAVKLSQCVSLSLCEIAHAHLALAEVYCSGGFVDQASHHLQQAEVSLSRHASQTAQSQPSKQPQVYQALQTIRVVRHAKLMKLQLEVEKGTFSIAETADELVEELEANKKGKEDIIALAWLKRLRSSCTNSPQRALQDAKDSFSLVISILPEYQLPSNQPPENNNGTQAKGSESTISRWQIVRHFLASVECIVQIQEQAGKAQEAYLLYRKALAVAIRSGALAYVARVSLGMGELEYYRHHWPQAKRLLRKAKSAIISCASFRSLGEPARTQNLLEHKNMLALIDMRLGDVYRRQGQLNKAEKNYNTAHNTITELPTLLSAATSITLLPQKCADASPRESRILSKLERTNKRVQLSAREAKKVPASKASDSKASGGSKSGKTSESIKPTRSARSTKFIKSTKSSDGSDSSCDSTHDSSSDETTKRRTRAKQVKLIPRAAKSKVAEEKATSTKNGGKTTSKAKRVEESSESEDAQETSVGDQIEPTKHEDLPFSVASLLARLEGKLARVQILRGHYSEAVKTLSSATQKETTPVTQAVLQLHLANAHILNGVEKPLPHISSTTLIEALSSASRCLIPTLKSRICHAIADLDGEQAPCSIAFSLGISARQQLCQVLALPDKAVDSLSTKMSNMTVEDEPNTTKATKPIPAIPAKSSRSKKPAVQPTSSVDTSRSSQEKIHALLAESSKYSTTQFKSLIENLPTDWVVCSLCVPRGQRALWVSRVQAGGRALALKIPLKFLEHDLADLNADIESDDSAESSATSSTSYEENSTASTAGWDVRDNILDEFLACSESDDEEDTNRKSNSASTEDGLAGTVLGAIISAAHGVIQTSNATAKKQAVTNKQKQMWWDNRKALDNKLKELVLKLEGDVLGWQKAILVAPPSNKVVRDALLEAAESLATDLEAGQEESVCSEESESKPTRIKSKATKTRTKPVTPASTTTTVHRALLEVCLSAVPFLTDSQIEAALASIAGRVVPHRWVNLLRETYEKCVSAHSKKSKDSEEVFPRQTLLLALDGKLQQMPWESMPMLDGQSVTRVPSLLFASILHNATSTTLKRGIDASQAFYMLNAEGDLSKTQECFEAPFKRRRGWEGIVGTRPSADDFKRALSEHELFVYCGHGSGEQYFKRDAVARLPQCGVALLMGCSSGQLSDEGDFEPIGMATSYLLALSPSVVGNLWDVTDGELDRLTKALLAHWLDQGMTLPMALSAARKTCQFRFLVAAAAVCYGVPVSVAT